MPANGMGKRSDHRSTIIEQMDSWGYTGMGFYLFGQFALGRSWQSSGPAIVQRVVTNLT